MTRIIKIEQLLLALILQDPRRPLIHFRRLAGFLAKTLHHFPGNRFQVKKSTHAASAAEVKDKMMQRIVHRVGAQQIHVDWRENLLFVEFFEGLH
jgi:hypothetical protein